MGFDTKDEILEKKREEYTVFISFLKSLKKNLDSDTAFKIALDSFAFYMISLYSRLLQFTEENSQERFDAFRKLYEAYALKTPYLKIIESNPRVFKVKYERCPFFEILKEEKLEEFGKTFCLSDFAFTKEVLYGVKFSRMHEISKGDLYCDNIWEYEKS